MPNDVTNTNAAILTLDSDAVLETAQSKADLIWHEWEMTEMEKSVIVTEILITPRKEPTALPDL